MKSSKAPLSGFVGEAAYRLPEIPALPPALGTLLREGRMLHAVLLEGESAAERRNMALALAGAILCEKGGGAMCEACRACRKVLTASHPDLSLSDPETDPECYKKAALRELRAAAWQRPVEGRAKVFLLLSAEKIPAEGQNLLLKLIEEPPEDTFFILGVSNRYRLLPTILSRAAAFSLPSLSDEDCLAALRRLVPGRSEEDYGRVLIRAGGSPAAGALLLTDPAVEKRYAAAEEMMAGLATNGVYRVQAAAHPFERDRAGYTALLGTLAGLLADPTLQKIYQFPPKAALAARGEITALLALTERNAYLPLVTALLTERALKR